MSPSLQNTQSTDDAGQSRVLVLDADMTAALSIARSLHRHGLVVDAASHEAQSLGSRSACVRRTLHYPSPLDEENAFLDWIAAHASSGEYRLIIPATERTLGSMHRHRERVDTARIAMPPADALEIALDKGRTIALAESLGIRAPHGREVSSEAQAVAFAADNGYPIVIKPASSIGSGDLARVHLSVSYATREAELRARVAHALRFGKVLVQERFSGDGIGIELIAEHGVIRYAFQHLRLHEVPLTGGGSSLRKSVAVDPAALDIATRLVQATRWHGVAMVELKQNPDSGELCLMEINGRFWGSLPLAVAAGADFPAMLYELLVDGQIRPRPPARTGVYCRNLARDTEWLELVLRRWAPSGLAVIPTWGQVFRDSLLILSPRHHFDVQQWRDPLPGLADLARILGGYVERAGSQIKRRRRLRRERAAWRGDQMRRKLGKTRNLLFLCYGNINRSALAEHLARERLADRFAVTSAGFHPRTDRPADPTMRAIASRRGLDLSASRSKALTPQMVESADLILAMDLSHLNKLCARFPQASSKAFLLGPVDPQAVPDGEIEDPYGKAEAVYEHCFDQVSRCIEALDALCARQ